MNLRIRTGLFHFSLCSSPSSHIPLLHFSFYAVHVHANPSFILCVRLLHLSVPCFKKNKERCLLVFASWNKPILWTGCRSQLLPVPLLLLAKQKRSSSISGRLYIECLLEVWVHGLTNYLSRHFFKFLRLIKNPNHWSTNPPRCLSSCLIGEAFPIFRPNQLKQVIQHTYVLQLCHFS